MSASAGSRPRGMLALGNQLGNQPRSPLDESPGDMERDQPRNFHKAPDARRQMLADWCKLLGSRLSGNFATPSTPAAAGRPDPLADVHLSRRERQILTCLLVGDSEKQIALKLTISQHTVHTYVKKLHKTLDVNSRGELMARFVSK